jgi:uncharacterized membrane protein
MSHIRSYLIAGLLIWLPVWITFLAIKFLAELMDNSLKLLPHHYQPDQLLGFHLPGLGIIFTILLLFFTGMIATNFLGRHLVNLWDKLIARIPLVRSIYAGVKNTLETVLSSKNQAFRKVLLIEYPRVGSWSIAFQTGKTCQKIADKTQSDMITVFVPTTPNPTSGFMIIVPREEVHELDLSIDDALKMIISLGVVQPTHSSSHRPQKMVKEVTPEGIQ